MEPYSELVKGITRNFNKGTYKHHVLFGIPAVPKIRMEWHNSMCSLVYPVNWSNSLAQIPIPLGGPTDYLVSDARNIIIDTFLEKDFQWLLYIDCDVEPPMNALLKFNTYMESYEAPIVAGLYYSKGIPSYPLVFRGRGNGAYCMEGGKAQWKIGDKIWVDGTHMGMTLIHKSIIQTIADESEEYFITGNVDKTGRVKPLKQVFVTPRMAGKDPQSDSHFLRYTGTEDLPFYDRLKEEEIYKKAGWSDIQKKEFPILVDTSIFCWHRDIDTGIAYPTNINYEKALKKQGYIK